MAGMKTSDVATLTISVFARHTQECPKHDDPTWRRCRCRKSLYIYADGKVTYRSARTRSWEQAERLAQAERDKRDPVKLELGRLEAKRAAQDCALADALDQWVAGRKAGGPTRESYLTFQRTVLRWAASQGVVSLSGITADALDRWVASWTDAPNTQGFRLSRLRAFCRWAVGLRKLDNDPTLMLRSIKREQVEETQPLTTSQFEELIAATYKYDDDRRVDKDRFGADLRAIFLVQRWTGLRIVDVLMLPRSGVRGNRIVTKMQKTAESFDQVVPVAVIEALNAVPVRQTMHPDQFFWSRKCDHRVLAGMWTPRIRRINKYISFTDDTGAPMQFRSHMLRDTFAVELLLAGMALDKVSKLLGHKSTRVTEKHYAPWVRARRVQLEDEMKAAMRKMGASFDRD